MYKQYVGNGAPYQDIWAYQPNTKGILFGSDEHIVVCSLDLLNGLPAKDETEFTILCLYSSLDLYVRVW